MLSNEEMGQVEQKMDNNEAGEGIGGDSKNNNGSSSKKPVTYTKKTWSQKGQAETIWGQVKERHIGTRITALAKNLLAHYFQTLQISFAEFLEELARGRLLIVRKQPSKLSTAITEEMTRKGWTIQDLAKESNLGEKRIQELIRSERPTETELVWLQSILSKPDETPYSYEELIELPDNITPQNEIEANESADSTITTIQGAQEQKDNLSTTNKG